MRRVTISFAPGTEALFGVGAAGLVVAVLKAASAVFHGSPAARVLFGGFVIGTLLSGSHCHAIASCRKGPPFYRHSHTLAKAHLLVAKVAEKAPATVGGSSLPPVAHMRMPLQTSQHVVCRAKRGSPVSPIWAPVRRCPVSPGEPRVQTGRLPAHGRASPSLAAVRT